MPSSMLAKYRKMAADCQQAALDAEDSSTRKGWVALAEKWHSMAERLDPLKKPRR